MKRQKTLLYIFILTGILLSFDSRAETYTLKSPDGKVSLQISWIEGKIQYEVQWSGQEVVGKSDLSIFNQSTVSVLETATLEQDLKWVPVWDQFSQIRDQYKQITLEIETRQVHGQLIARAYNEGVAFRYVLPEGKKPSEAEYFFTAKMPVGNQYYAPNGESEPLGPLSFEDLNHAQTTQGKDGKTKNIQVPLVVQTQNNTFLALLESDLYAAEGMHSMKMDLDIAQKKVVSRNKIALTDQEFVSPWRVILLGESAGELVVNTMTQNLATPNQLENSNWIKPGKTLWDWRVHGYTAPDGFTYGINTESYLRFIDFAAENNIEYFLIDDAWYSKVSKGHFEMSAELDLQKVIQYANKKDVELILYYDNRHGVYGDQDLFPYYQSLGMKGIKYGFMGNNVRFTKEAIRQSAQSKLLIDFHDGPVPYTGIRRTFPNAITREYCHGQQDSRRAFTPESFIKMALINAITGSLDMNNGNFDLIGINSGQREKGPKIEHSYLSTVASEAARTLIIFSGLVCIPDAPEAYAAKKDLFEFIQKQPVGQWDETKILNAEIASHITTARRHGKEWFIGSVIDQQGGMLDIPLDFLETGLAYDITYYEDTDQTHCETNPEAYQVRRGIVQKGDTVHAKLAPGGGHCMWIRPKK